MKLLVTLLGLILIIESLPYVAFPEAMQRWLLQLAGMSPSIMRRIGLAAMAGGLLLCYVTQRTDWID